MQTSKVRINRKMRRKTDSYLAETIFLAKKHKPWVKIANLVSRPRRKQISCNLEDIDKETREGDTVVVPGKVLANGSVTKKIRVAALYFSESAVRKLKDKKCERVTLKDEIKINPKAQGIKLMV